MDESQQLPIKKQPQRNVPRADKDFDTLVTGISQKWAGSPWLTLQWKTAAEFTNTANLFSQTLGGKDLLESKRSQTTGGLDALDEKIDDGQRYIKIYLKEKYEDRAEDYYAAFGMVRSGDRLMIPKDRDSRKAALNLMIGAIGDEGFNTRKYGKAYWEDIRAAYLPLLEQAKKEDGAVAGQSGDKNLHKTELKEVLNSLILALKANYPRTWKEQLREWGFQKEKY